MKPKIIGCYEDYIIKQKPDGDILYFDPLSSLRIVRKNNIRCFPEKLGRWFKKVKVNGQTNWKRLSVHEYHKFQNWLGKNIIMEDRDKSPTELGIPYEFSIGDGLLKYFAWQMRSTDSEEAEPGLGIAFKPLKFILEINDITAEQMNSMLLEEIVEYGKRT